MRKVYGIPAVVFCLTLILGGCGGGGGTQVTPVAGGTTPVGQTANASVSASASAGQEFLYEGNARVALSCATSGAVSKLEGKCSASDGWRTISSGNTMNCDYNSTGEFTPSCRANEAVDDNVDFPVTIKDFYEGEGYKIIDTLKDVSRMDYLDLGSVTDTTLTFKTTDASRVTLQAGNFLIETSPEEGQSGYLRKITAIQVAGDTVTVQTEDAAVEDIIESADMETEIDMSRVSGGKMIDSAGRVANAMNLNYTLNEDWVIYSSHATDTYTNFSASLMKDSSVTFTPTIDLKVNISWFKIKEFKFSANGTLSTDLDFKIAAAASTDYQKEKTLYTYVSPPIAWIGPVPLNVKFAFIAGVEAEASVEGYITTGFDASATVNAGSRYVDGSGWSNTSRFSHQFNPHKPQFGAAATASVKGYIKPEVTLQIAYVAGPAISVEPYVKAEAGVSTSYGLFWGLSAGLDVDLAFDVNILSSKKSSNMLSLETSLYSQEWPLLESDLLMTVSANPASGQISGGQFSTTLTCDVSGRPSSDISSIKARCDSSSPWETIRTIESRQCSYTSAGSYTPGCIVNEGTADAIAVDIGSPVVVSAAAPACGNSLIEAGEACDDGNTTTETCTYGQTSCTVCNSSCASAAGAVAGYCGDSTTHAGNGETCDNGASNGQPNMCNATCNGITGSVCGNSTTEAGETCDDGNTTTETCAYGQTSCTVCNANCQSAAGAVAGYCGDSTTHAGNGETCDNGASNGQPNMCNATCNGITGSVCGNSTTEPGETCDDGNTTTETCAYGQTSCTVCNATCQSAAGAVAGYCGDSTAQAGNGETCDDGNTTTETCAYGQTSCTVCNATCQSAAGAVAGYCGDNTTQAGNGETCDDGNTVTETCTYGQTSCTVCNATCQSTAGAVAGYCGDSTTQAGNGETCDDGNTTTESCTYGQTSCTVCNSSCASAAGTTSYCGDSTTQAGNGETCDDGNTAGGDGCSAACTTETLATNAWITIPAGDFVMGCASADGECYANESPKHTVTLSEYKIQKYEVTNAQYKACVTAGSCTAPPNANSSTRTPYYDNAVYDNYPVIYVNWTKASAYCAWIGGRLPTEAEWEKAARGPSPAETIYPWGNSAGNCTLMNNVGCIGDTDVVGAHPTGASYYGVMDMAGSVWEWVNDWIDETYYTTGGPPWSDPQGPGSGSSRVLRGGSWLNVARCTRVSHRTWYLPGDTDINFGFRCAKD